MIYTNTGLVKHAEMALTLNTKYMWGGILRQITNSYINMLRSTYGNQSGTGYSAPRWTELMSLVGKNYFGCDCVGLIKSYYWSGKENGGTGSPKYGAAGFPDVNANYMYQQAKVKGTIDTLPEIPGVIVYCRTHPHVGVYVGNGWVIESTLGARGDGVVKTKLSAFKWEHWFYCPYISYTTTTVTAAKTNTDAFKIGDKIYIKDTATLYAKSTVKIPAAYKGKKKSYTIDKISGDTVRLKELFSWVRTTDINIV